MAWFRSLLSRLASTPQWREIGERAAAAGLPAQTEQGRTLVALPRFDTLLEFIR